MKHSFPLFLPPASVRFLPPALRVRGAASGRCSERPCAEPVPHPHSLRKRGYSHAADKEPSLSTRGDSSLHSLGLPRNFVHTCHLPALDCVPLVCRELTEFSSGFPALHMERNLKHVLNEWHVTPAPLIQKLLGPTEGSVLSADRSCLKDHFRRLLM